MRRGLIARAAAEVPDEALARRLGRFRRAMAEDRLDCAIVYSSIVRPAAVTHLTQFVPYWNEAALIVPREGTPTLIAAFSKRVAGWIAEVSHGAEVVAAPDIANAAVSILGRAGARRRRIGIVERDALPFSVLAPIADAFGAEALIDASETFARARHPADEFEIALAGRAAAIAAAALESALATWPQASAELAAAIEQRCRDHGAEEVSVYCAPDLARDLRLRRIEGDHPLGARHAILVSVAYKGVWSRCGRTSSGMDPPPVDWTAAEAWFAHERAALASGRSIIRPPSAGLKLAHWSIEAARGGRPLAPYAGAGHPDPHAIPAGTPAVLGAFLATMDGAWFRADALAMGDAVREAR